MRALYEKNPKAITVAQKEAFVKAFVTKVCFRHKRKNIGTAANPVYGREYEEVGETGWKDAIVDIEMKWVAGAAVEWSGFVNLHGKDGKPLFGGDKDFRKENGYMLSAAHSEEDDEPIVFGDGRMTRKRRAEAENRVRAHLGLPDPESLQTEMAKVAIPPCLLSGTNRFIRPLQFSNKLMWAPSPGRS
jgi:hypothetical protein